MFSKADKTLRPPVRLQRKTEQIFFKSKKDKGVATSSSFFKPTIQPKIQVNQPNDRYEVEADQVAEKVVNMPDPQLSVAATSPPEIQREESEEK